jgi:Ni/Co efflux regulator RcnB
MDRLLTAEDLAERYRVTIQTARKYIRQMRHMENPLRTWESAATAWEAGKTVTPGETAKKPTRRVKYEEWVPGMRVPRRRTSA